MGTASRGSTRLLSALDERQCPAVRRWPVSAPIAWFRHSRHHGSRIAESAASPWERERSEEHPLVPLPAPALVSRLGGTSVAPCGSLTTWSRDPARPARPALRVA